MNKTNNLTPELAAIKGEIEGYAKSYGLDFFKTIFQLVDFENMNAIAAYGGFPSRYPHWKFGMEYERISKPYTYGLARIYELVINTDPTYAYLMESNDTVQQKMVMAHVYGHVDFFKNNYMFSHTNRKMLEEMANHSARTRRYIDRYGLEEVESFIETCVSLEHLIDQDAEHMGTEVKKTEEEILAEEMVMPKIKVDKEYMDEFINPKEAVEEDMKKNQERLRKKGFPLKPEKDILQFLIKHAKMQPWQKSIMDMIREESLYFAPQAQTKIMNEGWAVFWHSKIMTQNALKDSEVIDYAALHSSITQTGQGSLNPYALGWALFKDIEDRWNKGKHGKEWEQCESMEKRREWDTKENKGLEKVLEVRKMYNDITFIDEFLTQDFCSEQRLFTFDKHDVNGTNYWLLESRKFTDIKEKMLSGLTNFGLPVMFITDANYKNRGELLLHHKQEGKISLDLEYATSTLKNLEKVWKRPVNLETFVDKKWIILRSEGEKVSYTETKQEDLSYKY